MSLNIENIIYEWNYTNINNSNNVVLSDKVNSELQYTLEQYDESNLCFTLFYTNAEIRSNAIEFTDNNGEVILTLTPTASKYVVSYSGVVIVPKPVLDNGRVVEVSKIEAYNSNIPKESRGANDDNRRFSLSSHLNYTDLTDVSSEGLDDWSPFVSVKSNVTYAVSRPDDSQLDSDTINKLTNDIGLHTSISGSLYQVREDEFQTAKKILGDLGWSNQKGFDTALNQLEVFLSMNNKIEIVGKTITSYPEHVDDNYVDYENTTFLSSTAYDSTGRFLQGVTYPELKSSISGDIGLEVISTDNTSINLVNHLTFLDCNQISGEYNLTLNLPGVSSRWNYDIPKKFGIMVSYKTLPLSLKVKEGSVIEEVVIPDEEGCYFYLIEAQTEEEEDGN